MRVFGIGKQKTHAVLSVLGQLMSPRLSEEQKPNVNLEWIVQEQDRPYIKTVDDKIEALKKERALPSRKNMTSNEVQDGITDTG